MSRPRPNPPNFEVVSSRDETSALAMDGQPPLTLAGAFEQYAAYVARIGIRILGYDDQEIDDLVQDVFAEAVTGLRRMTNAAELRGWLATVTVRTAVRRLRKRKLRRLLLLDAMVPSPEPPSPAANPEQRALIMRAYRVLDRLPARERVAWVLRHVEGERLEDVARLCGCSLATAKRLIVRAEAAVEKEFKDVANS